jgi:hypothetical protein
VVPASDEVREVIPKLGEDVDRECSFRFVWAPGRSGGLLQSPIVLLMAPPRLAPSAHLYRLVRQILSKGGTRTSTLLQH